MRRTGEDRVETALKVLIQHLVLCFPQATIFSRPVGDTYQVFVIAPYDGSADTALQVERAWLADQASVDEMRQVLEMLNLPTVLESCARYDLGSAHRRDPANAGWPTAQGGGTVAYGPCPLSRPPLSTSPGALLSVRAD
jgi:hypothetical protein